MSARRLPLWVLALILAPVGLAMRPLSASSRTAQPSQTGKAAPADLAKGKEIFDSSCSRCHGLDGSGGEGSNIQGAPLKMGEQRFADTIRNGVPGTGMPAFSAMSASEFSQVAAYVATLGGVDSSAAAVGDIPRGKAVFNRSGCQNCHTTEGQGGDLGPDLTGIGRVRSADKLRQALLSPGTSLPAISPGFVSAPVTLYLIFRAVTKDGRTLEGMRVGEDSFGIILQDAEGGFHSLSKPDLMSLEKEPGKSFMPSVKGTMSDAELNDLIAYLASLNAAP